MDHLGTRAEIIRMIYGLIGIFSIADSLAILVGLKCKMARSGLKGVSLDFFENIILLNTGIMTSLVSTNDE